MRQGNTNREDRRKLDRALARAERAMLRGVSQHELRTKFGLTIGNAILVKDADGRIVEQYGDVPVEQVLKL